MDKSILLCNENMESIDYNSVIVVTIAEGGAMGEPNGVDIVLNDLTHYHFNLGYTDIDIKKFREKFSIFSSFRCFCEEVEELEKGWNWFNMGFGNYLLVREKYYTKYKEYIENNLEEDYEHGPLYNKWYEILKIIVKKRN